MTIWGRMKLWARRLWAALEAAEAGPYGHMDDQIVAINKRVARLEKERSNIAK